MAMGNVIDMQKMSNDMKQIVFGTLPAHEREVLAYAKDAQWLMTLREKLKAGVNISKEEAKRAADICLRYFDVFSVDNGLKKYKGIDYYKTGVSIGYLLKLFLYTVCDCLHEAPFEKDNLIGLAIMIKDAKKLDKINYQKREELKKKGRKTKSPYASFFDPFFFIMRAVHNLIVHPEMTEWTVTCNNPIFSGAYVEPPQFENVYYYSSPNTAKLDWYKVIDYTENAEMQNLAIAKTIAISKYTGAESFAVKSSIDNNVYIYLPHCFAPYIEPVYRQLTLLFNNVDKKVMSAYHYEGPVTNQFFDNIKILVDFFEDKLPGCISLESCKGEIESFCKKEQTSERKKLVDIDDSWMEMDR